jgi:hypothetical protein
MILIFFSAMEKFAGWPAHGLDGRPDKKAIPQTNAGWPSYTKSPGPLPGVIFAGQFLVRRSMVLLLSMRREPCSTRQYLYRLLCNILI